MIDRARRNQLHSRKIVLVQPICESEDSGEAKSSGDDLLQFILVCCHPALAPDAQLVLILRIVLGFDTAATARALLASKDAIKKRLVRAKTKIRDAGIPFGAPAAEDLDARLEAVCDALRLMFNEGYSRPASASSINLCDEALRLARRLASLRRDNRDVRSLLALMLFGMARLPARYDKRGTSVPLDLQDRALWNQALIGEGLATLESVFYRRLPPTSLQLQAAISACHCRENHASNTDWAEITALYGRLEQPEPTPVVKINRAVALARQGRLAAGASLLADLERHAPVRDYQPFHAACGFLLEAQGRKQEAVAAYTRAVRLSEDSPERRFLEDQARTLSESG